MEKAVLFALFALPLACFADDAAPPATPPHDNRALFQLWAKIQNPLAGDPKPIGSYAAGCIAGAHTLPLDGTGFSVMRPSRRRFFGHPDLVAFLEQLGREAASAKLGRVLIGDMGRPRGGPMQTGHSSHQIGLDVDVWFRLSGKKPTKKQRETWGAESFVKDEAHVTKRWNAKERKLVELAASSPFVARVFVHPAIKRDLCEKFPSAAWLHKIRPWWAHQDHLHVRLHCPAGASSCKEQEPTNPANPECGKELAWWFSAEAKEEGAKKDAAFRERQFPELPAECDVMVKDLEAKR
jgi:penicillin-insensitive murein endopeptidase